MDKTASTKPADMAIEHQETQHDAHVEPHVKEASMEAAAKGQGISGYEGLSLWQTVKAFKVNTLTCFIVAFSAATDGYQIG